MARYPVLEDYWCICDLHTTCYLVSVRGLGSQDPQARVNSHPARACTRGIHGPFAQADQAGRICPASEKQPISCLHPHYAHSLWAVQLPMPALLCPVPRSSGSNRLPLTSWAHPDLLLRDSSAPIDVQAECESGPVAWLASQDLVCTLSCLCGWQLPNPLV